MWEYIKLRNGYVRSVGQYSDKRFMFDMLCTKMNRNWWYQLLEYTVCKVFKHKASFLTVEKGYTEKLGTFEITLCDRCRCGIMFYEGKNNE
jgi:hypothetical protein